MTKKVIVTVLAIMFATVLCFPATADYSIQANLNISNASITLSSTMTATFTCSTYDLYNISVSSVKLQVQNSNGTWSSSALSAPSSVSNSSSLLKTMSYSGSCTKGKTYRISCTFNAGGESVTRTSSTVKY